MLEKSIKKAPPKVNGKRALFFVRIMWYNSRDAEAFWQPCKPRLSAKGAEAVPQKRKGRPMFWILSGALCLIYYVFLETLAAGQELTVIWLLLAVLFLGIALYKNYRKACPGKKPPLWVRTFFVTSLVLLAVLTGVTESRIVAGMVAGAPEGLEYIVILSQEELPGESEEELVGRLDRAVSYLQENPQTCAIVSGGWDSEKGSSRAFVMYRYLLRQGISSERIFWETYSRSTVDNLVNSAAIAGGRQARLGIVVSDYFAYRAVRLARNERLPNVCSVTAATPSWLLPHRLVQELLRVLQDKFFGI